MVRRSLLVLALLAALASCASFQFESQRIFLRYSPETDVLDALLVYEGVGANEADSWQAGGQAVTDKKEAETVACVAQGTNHFILLGWPLEFEIEKMLRQLDADDPLGPRFVAFVETLEILEAKLVLDPAKELCLLQRVRIREASAGLRLLDASLNRSVAESFDDDDTELVGDDPETDALWRRRARDNGSWLRFEGDTLVLSVPTTARQFTRFVREWLEEDAEEVKQAAGWLTSVHVTGDEARLSFAPGDDGWIHFSASSGREVAPALARILTERGAIGDGTLDTEVLRLLALE